MKSNRWFAQAWLGAAIVAIAVTMVPATGYAQFDTATVLGTVRDPNGAILPGVTVTLKNIDTSISVNAQTDADGNYQFTNIRIGNYRVSAEKQGFSTAVAERVNVTVNARQRVDLTMQPGAVTESVVVTGAAQLLETDSKRPRSGCAAGSDRQPAAQWPFVSQPGVVDARCPRVLTERCYGKRT